MGKVLKTREDEWAPPSKCILDKLWARDQIGLGPTKPARENLQMQCNAIHDNWVGRGALNQGCVNVHNKVLTADNYNVFNFSTMQ